MHTFSSLLLTFSIVNVERKNSRVPGLVKSKFPVVSCKEAVLPVGAVPSEGACYVGAGSQPDSRVLLERQQRAVR